MRSNDTGIASAAERRRSAGRCASMASIDRFWRQNAYDLLKRAKRSASAATASFGGSRLLAIRVALKRVLS